MSKFTALSGYGFDQSGSFIQLDQHENRSIDRELFYLVGKSFTLKKELGRYCTGQFDLKTLENDVCPNSAELLSPKANNCYDCFESIGFNPAFYHLEQHQISPQQRAYNQTKHIVYLAYFAPGLIKVGISSNDRKEHRWKEQGARFIAHIYTVPNAYEARHIEEKISSKLKLPEVVLGKKKRVLLNKKLDFNAVRSDFSSLMDQIDSILPTPANRERVYDMEEYFNPNGIQLASTIIDVSEHSDGKISGKCIGFYGDIVLFENSGQQFMFSLKKMISYKVSLSDRVEGMDFEPQQISMF
ncbi:MAG: DUF2797 domain-containing protein [Crocinitomicaceae bacterium]|nr:DUF2797 domain-containing protein [Flavobacteriales bacterium]NQZ36994.1 DUF2797 domain-containing protein [Crocinitomicaceae bacterium]